MAYWSAGAAAAGSTISVASSAAELARIVLWNVGDVLTVDSHVLAPKERGCPTAWLGLHIAQSSRCTIGDLPVALAVQPLIITVDVDVQPRAAT
jgi:hypothetical protein